MVCVYLWVCVFCPLQRKRKEICVTIYLTKYLFIVCFKTNIYWNIRWGHVIVILGYMNKIDLIHMVMALNCRLFKKNIMEWMKIGLYYLTLSKYIILR